MFVEKKKSFYPFFNKDFFRLWFAVLLFAAGTWQEHVSIGYLIYELTNSELQLTFVFAVRFIPFLIISNYIGYLADIINRKNLLSLIMLVGSVGMFGFASLIYFEIYNYFIILTYVFLSGCIWSSVMLTQQSYSFDIIGPKFAAPGTALTKGADRIGGAIGGYFAGKLVSRFFHLPFLLSGVFQLLASMMILSNSKLSKFSPDSKKSNKPNITEILFILKNNKVLLGIILLTIGTEIFGFSHNGIIPVLVKDVLNGDSDDLGFMMVLRQLGGIAGILSIIIFGHIQRKGLWLLNSALGLAFSVLFLGFANNYYIFIIVIFLLNIFASSCDSLYQIIAQKSVPNSDRGKAMGAWVFALGTGPLGYLIMGLIITFVKSNEISWLPLNLYNSPGPQFALNLNGFILIIIVLIAIYYSQKLKEFKD